MKKLLAALMAAALAMGMALPAFAEENAIIDEVDMNNNDDAYYYLPGKTYKFNLESGGYELDSEFYEYFRTSLKILEGKQYIEKCDIEKQRDGTYDLVFKAKKGLSYTEPKLIKIQINAKEKRNSDNRGEELAEGETYLEFEVGYNDTAYVSDEVYYVNPEEPIIEFGSNLDKCTLIFDYKSEYTVRLDEKLSFNILSSTEPVEWVEEEYGDDADLTYISFYAKPTFEDAKGKFRIYAPGAKYAYEITSKGLVELDTTKVKENYLEFTTKQLTSYVASDKKLDSSVSPSGSSSSKASSTSSSSTPASSGSSSIASSSSSAGTPSPAPSGKPNPNTGVGALYRQIHQCMQMCVENCESCPMWGIDCPVEGSCGRQARLRAGNGVAPAFAGAGCRVESRHCGCR
ncbi:hypothetical protein LQE96_02860 [Phocea massiliensis]|uniref:Uncharacterized protein n=1 Tax=uncultured Anaerotruncus sp. TaxID=905011 RepID=A0A6N2TID0_9FIRM|nr:hypothetical protein [Merdimmobilis hominis]MCD4835774.1 hypothetical protein [Merdimmobilis hominis]